MTRFYWVAAIIYALVLAVLAASLFTARRHTAASFATEQAQVDWEQWRAAASRQDGATTPVERRVPSSAEPPTLVLLRDHFTVVFAGTMVITSAVYWALALMLRGAVWGPGFEITRDDGPAKPG